MNTDELAKNWGAIVDQPPPVATARRPSWEIVIDYLDGLHGDNAYGSTGVVGRVISDARDRDYVGRSRYGTPLTAGNGRNHLVDSYQEIQDSCAYLVTELDEYGVGPSTNLDNCHAFDQRLRWRLHCVQQLFASQVRSLIQLRALIEERKS